MNTIAPPPILDTLSSLGDETRLRILRLLEESEFTVSELRAALRMPQPTVSRNLRRLAEDGWVVHRNEGRNRHYRLAPRLPEASRALWELVRSELADGGVYAEDAERARGVLAERRRRSAAFFAAAAHRWEPLRRELYGAHAHFLPLLGLLDPRWTVADLGCGTGDLAALLAPHVDRVIAVDASAEMLTAARARLSGVAHVEVRAGALEDLPLETGCADLAVLSLVLHYVPDPAAALREAARILRPGGRLVVLDLRAHDEGPRYAERMGHLWAGFDEERMRGWLTRSGLHDVRITALPPDPEAQGPLLFLASARCGGSPTTPGASGAHPVSHREES